MYTYIPKSDDGANLYSKRFESLLTMVHATTSTEEKTAVMAVMPTIHRRRSREWEGMADSQVGGEGPGRPRWWVSARTAASFALLRSADYTSCCQI